MNVPQGVSGDGLFSRSPLLKMGFPADSVHAWRALSRAENIGTD
jgi:hypothetical protein